MQVEKRGQLFDPEAFPFFGGHAVPSPRNKLQLLGTRSSCFLEESDFACYLPHFARFRILFGYFRPFDLARI